MIEQQFRRSVRKIESDTHPLTFFAIFYFCSFFSINQAEFNAKDDLKCLFNYSLLAFYHFLI